MPTQRVGDINLNYQVAGKGSPFLLIHGVGSSARDWEPQIDAFSKHYKVIAVDVRGHGLSDKPPGPYSIAQFSADIIGLMRSLSLGATHVVGLSMGGMIAFQMAVDAPDLVKSLVIVNSGPEIPTRTLKEKLAVWQRLILFRLFSMRRIGEVIGRRLFPNPDQAQLLEIFVTRWAENDKRAYMDATRALFNWSVVERLGEIRCPVLIVASDQDYTPVSAKEAYMKRIPHAELAVIGNAHHAVPVERPSEFNEAVEIFLAKWK